jgi:F-type H+-transporting ATPase subunit delta
MASTASRNKPVVARYARALLQLANKHQKAEAYRDELNGLGEVLKASPTFSSLIGDPAVSESTRASLLQRTFTGRVDPVVSNFLGLLNSKGRLGLLPDIIEEYAEQLEDQLGNIEVDVTVAQKLSSEQLEQVRQRVSKAIGRNAVVHQYVDEDIIGGLVIRVQDKLIDASVRHQLESMRKQLLSKSPK